MFGQTISKQSRRVAVFSLVAAGSINAALMAALLDLFDSASQVRWLAAGEPSVTLMKACDREPHTSARHACLQTVVAQAERRASGVAVARSDSVVIRPTLERSAKP